MGYYSEFSLETNDLKYHDEAIGESTDYEMNVFESVLKWYEHETDMKKYSLKHPETVFKLSILGEDGEREVKFFKNGKMQIANVRIVHDEFNEDKLV
jgi:hypothetical protein